MSATSSPVTEQLATHEFTMKDVCLELEELKSQMSTSGAPISVNQKKSKHEKEDIEKRLQRVLKTKECTLPKPRAVNDHWSLWNHDNKFLKFRQSMKDATEEKLLKMASEEIGKRIGYHKQLAEANGSRIHVHFKNKLNELRNKLDRHMAVVILYVLQKLKPGDIEALERRLFPIPLKLLMDLP